MHDNKELLNELSEEKRETLMRECRDFASSSPTKSGTDYSNQQISAFRAYLKTDTTTNTTNDDSAPGSRPPGADGSSQYVAGAVAETVDIMQSRAQAAIFKQPQFVHFESETEEYEGQAKMQTKKVESVIRDEQVDGYRCIHDWIKNGLIGKIGIMRIQAYYAPPVPETFRNMTAMQLEQMLNEVNEKGWQVEGQVEKNQTGDRAQFAPDGMAYDITIRRPPAPQIVLDALPIEALLITDRCDTLDQRDNRGSQYVGIKESVTLGRVTEMFPHLADKLKNQESDEYKKATSSQDDSQENDERYFDRFSVEQGGNSAAHRSGAVVGDSPLRQEVDFFDEHIRFDANDDGMVELLRVQRVGGLLLHIEEVDDNNLAWWTPYPLPNKAIGESLVDKVIEFQHIETSLARAGMDALKMAMQPIIFVDANRMQAGNIEGDDTLKDLSTARPGDVVRTMGNPKEVIHELVLGEQSTKVAFDAMSFVREMREERVGITAASKGAAGGAPVNRTAAGMAMGQTAGNALVTYIVDGFSAGLKILATKIRDILIEHGVANMTVRTGDRVEFIDPSQWSKLGCRVNVGGAMMNPQERITYLTMFGDKQAEIIAAYGVDNPLCSLVEWRETYVEIAAALGHKDPERFFRSVSAEQVAELAEKMAAENPEAQKLQAEMEREQAKLDMEMQRIQAQFEMEMMKAQSATELEVMKMQATAEMDAAKMQFEMKMRQVESTAKIALEAAAEKGKGGREQMKMMIEAMLKENQQEIEKWLEVRGQNIEAKLAERKNELDAKAKKDAAKISGVRPGGKVG